MKILHTADWHIGKTLYGRTRYDEFEAFLTWLIETIHKEQIDVLLIAGDVFDTSMPNNRSQELYYRFLCLVAASPCLHVIVTAGNHDSPSFLNAPKDLLRSLNIHVIGSIKDDLEEEVFVLKNQNGIPKLIVCAVPYLRDRDIRTAEYGESLDDKERKLIEGIHNHYLEVCKLAEKKREELNAEIPIIAMGHLFASAGETVSGDGVRDLYVGSLAHISASTFPNSINYLALGHLHVPQKLGGLEHMRYSGSPLPMGFGEANQQKSVCNITFSEGKPTVELIHVPQFQKLEYLRGSWEDISGRIKELSAISGSTWLEVVYEGKEVISDLRERLDEVISNTEIEILRLKNNRLMDSIIDKIDDNETLDDLHVNDVFERCLAMYQVSEEQRQGLLQAFNETIRSLHEDDTYAQ